MHIDVASMASVVDPEVVGPEFRRLGFRSIFEKWSTPADVAVDSPEPSAMAGICLICGSHYVSGQGWVNPGCSGNCSDC